MDTATRTTGSLQQFRQRHTWLFWVTLFALLPSLWLAVLGAFDASLFMELIPLTPHRALHMGLNLSAAQRCGLIWGMPLGALLVATALGLWFVAVGRSGLSSRLQAALATPLLLALPLCIPFVFLGLGWLSMVFR